MKALISLAAVAVALSAASLTVSLTHAGPRGVQGARGVAGPRGPQGDAAPAPKDSTPAALGVCVSSSYNSGPYVNINYVDTVTSPVISASGVASCSVGTYVPVTPVKQ
jgi:hypothetical protein